MGPGLSDASFGIHYIYPIEPIKWIHCIHCVYVRIVQQAI